MCMQLGRQVADGDRFGIGTGEGPSKGDCATYKVKIYNHYADETVEVEVPEDRCDTTGGHSCVQVAASAAPQQHATFSHALAAIMRGGCTPCRAPP